MTDLPCELAHLAEVRIQGVQTLQVSDFNPVADLLPTHARTLVHGGRPIACFGALPMWPGVGQAWAVLSDEVLKDHPMALSRRVRRWLAFVADREGYRRIQATVADGHTAGHRWIGWLGFQHGGLLRNYGIGGHGDFHLYARLYAHPRSL